MTWRRYSLTVGLPQTNYRHLAEAKILMEACNFFWWSLGEGIGRPVSQLRAAAGDPLYATIFFVEEVYPRERTLGTFRLDDRLRFAVALRAITGLSVEGRVLFDREDRLADGSDPEALWRATPAAHPTILFGSLFGTPQSDNSALKLSAPGNASLSALPRLPLEENKLQIARTAQQSGQLGVIREDWVPLDPAGPHEANYVIDADRDTNAAGLVYFANYVSFLEIGERQAIPAAAADGRSRTRADLDGRQLLHRRIAYYGNAGLSDRIVISVSRFAPAADQRLLGVRCRLNRARDGTQIGLSEAIFLLSPGG